MKLLTLLPLLVVISLVYAATRYEDWRDIRVTAIRTFCSFSLLLGIVFLVLVAIHLWVL